MTDREKVLKGLECCSAMSGHECRKCPYSHECIGIQLPYGHAHLAADALEQIQAYQQLLEWTVECGFGYDNIPELYEQYKNEIEGMSYTDGLLYLASRSLEKGKSNVYYLDEDGELVSACDDCPNNTDWSVDDD